MLPSRTPVALALLLLLSPRASALAEEPAVKPIAVVQLTRTEPVSYSADVKPILAQRCLVCHSGPIKEGKLDLSSYDAMLRGGEQGPAVIPGKGAESLLVKLAGRTAGPAMPPPGEEEPLTPEQLALLTAWINQGAKPPAAESATLVPRGLSPRVVGVHAVAIADDKSLIAVARGGELRLFQPSGEGSLRTLTAPVAVANQAGAEPSKTTPPAHASLIHSLAFQPAGKQLASGALGEVAVWDMSSGKQLHRLAGHADRVAALAYSPNGKLLATGGGVPTVAGEIHLYDAESGKLALRLADAHSDSVLGLAFSPDGTLLATGSADQLIKVWSVPDGKLQKTLKGHTHHVLDVDWRPDGLALASGGADKVVKYWDYKTGEQITRQSNSINPTNDPLNMDHPQQVNRLRFVRETAALVTIAGDEPARLWEFSEDKRGPLARSRREFSLPGEYLYALAVSPDGELLILGGESGRATVWNLADGKPLLELKPDE